MPFYSSRDSRRRAWVVLQLLVVLPFMFATATVIEMGFAEPGKGFLDQSGTYVACEALAPRAKSYTQPRCARFGSMETNPAGFGVAVASFTLLAGIIWLSCRPGRGLRFSRRS